MGEVAHIASESPSGALAGRRLGHYQLITQVAQGGMAGVYLAVDVSSPEATAVAVKVIHRPLARDADLVRMFFDEARLASQIEHLNIARVLDFGSEGSIHFLVMDYLLGETWQQVLCDAVSHSSGGPRMRLALLLAHVLRQTALGLHAAHEARDARGAPLGVVHRDVSPQNIMVGYDGEVHVLDFGIAKAGNRIHDTERGTVKGRFAYMAPEQMRGSAVDRRADLWSLGVVLWEGLTHHRLFRRESDPETIMASAYAPIPSPSDINPSAPIRLCQIAERLLQRQREQRPDTALEVAHALAEYLRSEGVVLSQQTIRTEMTQLFGERARYRRSELARWRRRYSRPVTINMVPSEDVPTLPLPGRPTAYSGIRARKDKAGSRGHSRPAIASSEPTGSWVLDTLRTRLCDLSVWSMALIGLILGACAYLWLAQL